VNRTLVTTFWQQRASSAFRMAFLLIGLCFPLLMMAAMPQSGLQFMRDAVGLTLVLAAGMIGQDVSAGVLHLLFARPVSRSEYVLSRWLSVVIAATVLAILQLALAWLILSARGYPPEAKVMTLTMAQRVFEVIQIAAVMAFFSSLVSGVGDLGLWFVTMLTGGTIQLAAQAKGWGWLNQVGSEISKIVGPDPGLVALAGGTGGWTPLVTTLSISALALLAAVLMVNRKELSYASG
jgi:hypothetical protein